MLKGKREFVSDVCVGVYKLVFVQMCRLVRDPCVGLCCLWLKRYVCVIVCVCLSMGV